MIQSGDLPRPHLTDTEQRDILRKRQFSAINELKSGAPYDMSQVRIRGLVEEAELTMRKLYPVKQRAIDLNLAFQVYKPALLLSLIQTHEPTHTEAVQVKTELIQGFHQRVRDFIDMPELQQRVEYPAPYMLDLPSNAPADIESARSFLQHAVLGANPAQSEILDKLLRAVELSTKLSASSVKEYLDLDPILVEFYTLGLDASQASSHNLPGFDMLQKFYQKGIQTHI